MIDRYTRPEMGSIWTDQINLTPGCKWKLLLVRLRKNWDDIPKGITQEIRDKASFNVDRILEIEASVKHDVIAFLTQRW